MAEMLNQSSVESSRLAVSRSAAAASLQTYEQRLASDLEWALSEGSKYFEERGAVHEALRRIARRLDELGLPYAIVGGLAMFTHGFRRFTEDVDILVTREDLKKIHEQLEGRGYLRAHRYSKHLRDTELGVRIEFLVTGDYPGDGKPKPVSFPDPAAASEVFKGIHFVRLATLVELKIASGMSGADRQKDLVDVQEIIKVLELTKDYAEKLNPYVREKFVELWSATRPPGIRYVDLWRNKFLTLDAKSIDEMIDMLGRAVDQLKALRDDGVFLDPDGGTGDDYAHLVTTDPEVAKKYGMVDEREFWGDDVETEEAQTDESARRANEDEPDKPTESEKP